MKGTISRHSNVTAKGYSGVFHNQGGMITDADLNEGNLIARIHTEQVGGNTVKSGAPAKGGVVGNQNPETPLKPFVPFLRPGVVYADGVRGEVRGPDRQFFGPDDPLALLREQLDLPGGTYPKDDDHYVVYADIWQRDVHPLEDARLAEIAFHGALTSFRQQTMAQLKVAPAKLADTLGKPYGDYPKVGGGVLSLEPVLNADTGNACDPCATEIPLDAQVANALFRVEIVALEGSAQKPEMVSLAWSMENGAEIADPADLPAGFHSDGFAYEHANLQIEAHKGAFSDSSEQRVGRFAAAPEKVPGETIVRRWDGKADFAIGGDVSGKFGSGTAKLNNAGMPQIDTGFFTISLDLADKSALVGDYWLVEVRTNGAVTEDDDGRFYVVSPTPLGITHHYAPLFEIEGEKPLPLSDPARRQVTFPPLTDIPARSVSYLNTCTHLYGDPEDGGAVNVQQALDALCNLNTGQIKLKTPCPSLFGNATSLDGALKALCKHDFGGGSDRSWMKYMMDWGVVCGLKVTRSGDVGISVTPGAYLDWTGDFVVAEWDTAITVKSEEIRLDRESTPLEELEPYCLGIERLDGERTSFVVAPYHKFTRASDRTLYQRNQACNQANLPQGLQDFVESLDRVSRTHLNTAMYSATSVSWQSNPPRMTRTAADSVQETVAGMASVFYQGNDQMIETTKAQIEAARAHYPTDGLKGMSLDHAYGRQAAAMVAVVIAGSQILRLACKCAIILPDCPDFDQKPVMVPLAEIEFTGDDTIKTVEHVCMLKCRRLALTPRTMSYYLRETVEEVAAKILSDQYEYGHPMGPILNVCCEASRASGNGGSSLPNNGQPWVIDEGQKVPDQHRRPFDIKGWNRDAAIDELSGNGIDIAEEIDVTLEGAEEKIAEAFGGLDLDARLENREHLAPGDTVVLLTDGPTAVGYILIDQGGGKYPYTPASERVVVIQSPGYEYRPKPGDEQKYPNDGGDSKDDGKDNDVIDVSGLSGRLEGVRRQFAELSDKVEVLRSPEGAMGKLEADYGNLDAAIAQRLEEARKEAAEVGGDMPARFEDFKASLDEHEQLLTDIEGREAGVKERLKAQLDALLADGLGDHEEAMQSLLGNLATQMGDTTDGHETLKKKIDQAALDLGEREATLTLLEGRMTALKEWLGGQSLEATLASFDRLEERRSALDSAVATAGESLGLFEDRLKAAHGSLALLQDGDPELDGKIETLKEAVEGIKRDLPELLESRAQGDTDHSAQLAQHQQNADNLDQFIATQIEVAKGELTTLTGRHGSLDTAIGLTGTALGKLETSHEEKLVAAQAEFQSLLTAIEENNDAVTSQLSELEQLRAQALIDAVNFMAEAESQIAQTESTRETLNGEISDLTNRLSDEKEAATLHDKTVTDLETRADDLKTRVDDLNALWPKDDGALQSLTDGLVQLTTDTTALLAQRAASDAEHAANVAALSRQVEGFTSGVDGALVESRRVLNQIIKDHNLLDFDGSRETLADIQSSLEAQLRQIETQGNTAISDLASARDNLLGEIAETEEKVDGLSSQATTLTDQVTNKLAEQGPRVTKLLADAVSAKTTADAVTISITRAQEALPGLRNSADGIVSDARRELNGVIGDFQKEFDELQDSSKNVIRAMRVERPTSALHMVQERRAAQALAKFGIFTVLDIIDADKNLLGRIEKEDGKLGDMFGDDLVGEALEYVNR